MKMDFFTLKRKTQDFVLRLFVEPDSGGYSTPSDTCYTCSHCGTRARLH